MKKMTFLVAIGAMLAVGLATTAGADQSVGAAADQSIVWVSVSPDGSANGGNGPVGVSDDGRFVAFATSTSLLPGDTDAFSDVYVRDMQTGSLEFVSVSSEGTKGNSNSGLTDISISDDGRFVVFGSTANNLVPGDTNNNYDIFIYDRQTYETQIVPRDDGAVAEQAFGGVISGDGQYIGVVGTGYLAAAPVGVGVFVFDRVGGTVEQVVADGVAFTGASLRISDDGQFVAFTSREFDNNDDIILVDRDTDTYEIANPRIGGEAAQSRLSFISLSGDGRFVAFDSVDTNLVAGDAPGTMDAFVYNSDTNELERIVTGGAGDTERPNAVLSDDGRYFAFTSYNDVHGTANGVSDVALYDRQTDEATVISVNNDGSPADRRSGSYLSQSAISGDGRFVAFVTEYTFDPNDSGASVDFYIVDREGIPGGDDCANRFGDVDGSNTFVDDICWLADQGITRGCNPPANTEFCPKDPVTRGQMAAFLVRALGYTDDGGGNLFIDDNGNTFEGDIDKLGTAGVTRGCNPPTNDRFCPDDNVTREQMAAFLRRALDG